MKNQIQRFRRSDEGLATVEYAVAGALITLGIVTAFITLGDAVTVAIQRLVDIVADLT